MGSSYPKPRPDAIVITYIMSARDTDVMATVGTLDRWWFVATEYLRKAESGIRRLPILSDSAVYRELHVRVTFRAAVDSVIPRTPELEAELGPEHVPGGNDIGLAEFLIEFVDGGFQLGLPHTGPIGNAPAAEPVANILDAAALALLVHDEAVTPPSRDRAASLLENEAVSASRLAIAAGPFARLERQDRLRAINILDQIEKEVTLPGDTLFEFDAGLVGQLMVGFTTLVYYSEWEGYEDFTQPPSERTHSNDPADVQSWRQTGFPGFKNGYPALRGYLGTKEGPLGAGDVWQSIDEADGEGVNIYYQPGEFRDNEYDTSDYEELYPEQPS